MKRTLSAAVFAAIAASASLADDRTMSFNSEIEAVPAPGEVVVDGKTGDWDLSAGVLSYNDPAVADSYSVWTHFMWDSKGVYMLARYRDEASRRPNLVVGGRLGAYKYYDMDQAMLAALELEI